MLKDSHQAVVIKAAAGAESLEQELQKARENAKKQQMREKERQDVLTKKVTTI